MIHLHYDLLNSLEKHNNLSTDASLEEKVEVATKVIGYLNKEINKRRTSEMQVVREWLNRQISDNFVFYSSVQVDRVPSMCEGYCVAEKRGILEHIEFFQSCRRILDYLEREEKRKNEHTDR